MIELKDGFKLVGLKLHGKTTNQNNKSSQDCGDLWKKFEMDKIFELVPNKLSNEIFAVYFDYEGDHTKPFSYFIGCKVPESLETPKDLQDIVIPSQNYTKFTAKGVMTGCITDTWETIWKSEIYRKFGFDFEIYDERSQNWDDTTVDIYISIY